MGGKQKLAKAQQRANQIAQTTARKQRRAAKRERKVSTRLGKRELKSSRRQNRQILAAERRSAAKMAELAKNDGLETEFIEDEEVAKRKLRAQGGRSAYGFARGNSQGLGGGYSQLG
jgi:predicted nuclease of restriction endonuclease-like (RecB) superfamily